MKKIILGILASFTLWQAGAADLNWETDVPKALAEAKAANKVVLLDFTGSDWCYWCKKLNTETFSQPEFATYSSTNLVLVEVDFPRTKVLPDDLKAANKALKEKYQIKGYPTLIVLKPDGSTLWQNVGYMEGGPAALIAKIDGAQKAPQ